MDPGLHSCHLRITTVILVKACWSFFYNRNKRMFFPLYLPNKGQVYLSHSGSLALEPCTQPFLTTYYPHYSVPGLGTRCTTTEHCSSCHSGTAPRTHGDHESSPSSPSSLDSHLDHQAHLLCKFPAVKRTRAFSQVPSRPHVS